MGSVNEKASAAGGQRRRSLCKTTRHKQIRGGEADDRKPSVPIFGSMVARKDKHRRYRETAFLHRNAVHSWRHGAIQEKEGVT